MRKTRRAVLWALVVAVALIGAACGGGGGGGDGDDGVATADGSEGSENESDDDGGGGGGGRPDESELQDAALEYAQCMRDHGIDMPDPEFDGEGGVSIGIEDDGTGGGINPEDPEFQAAEEECQPIMDEVMPQEELSPEEQAERQDEMVAWAECMRGRGHDIADPVVDENGGVMIGGPAPAEEAQGERPSPGEEDQFQEDSEACVEQTGGGLGGPGGGPDGEGGEDESDDEGDA